jgi:hypothetical protein
MFYRFYLLDSDRHIRAAESFCASDETEAKQVAATVYEACSDVCYITGTSCGAARSGLSSASVNSRTMDRSGFPR